MPFSVQSSTAAAFAEVPPFPRGGSTRDSGSVERRVIGNIGEDRAARRQANVGLRTGSPQAEDPAARSVGDAQLHAGRMACVI
jgi:hypothetical protein